MYYKINGKIVFLVLAFVCIAGCQSLGVRQQSLGVITGNQGHPTPYDNTIQNTTNRNEDFDTLTGQLPELYIYVDSEITKENDIPVKLNLFWNTDTVMKTVLSLSGSISGRGNSTRDHMPKKPYKFELSKPTSLLGLPAKKDWILLANYADKTLIRNYLVDWLAQQMDSPFAPSARFVELYLNDSYQGNYMLTDREVTINKLKNGKDNPTSITSGWILEIDQRASEDNKAYFQSHYFPIKIRTPKQPSDKQLSYITSYIKHAEDVLYGDYFQDPHEGFRVYRDEDSIIKRFLISELVKNVDSRDYSSIRFFKDNDGLLKMGPLRDFDYSIGNTFTCNGCTSPYGRYVRNNARLTRMYEDPAFRLHTRQIRDQYKPIINELIPLIDNLTHYLHDSQINNFKLWSIQDSAAHEIYGGESTYDREIEFLKGFLIQRIERMDENL